MFDDLVVSSANPKTHEFLVDGDALGDRSGWIPGRDDSDSLDLHRSAAQGNADHVPGSACAASAATAPAAAIQRVVKPVVRLIHNGQMMAPTVIPKKVAMIKEEELPPDIGSVGVTGGVPGGVAGGSAGGVLAALSAAWLRICRLRRRRLPRASASAATCRPRRWSGRSCRCIRRLRRQRTSPAQWFCTPSSPRTARSRTSVCLRSSAADEVGDGCREAVALSADQLNGDPVEVDTTISVVLYIRRLSRARLSPALGDEPV